MFTGVSKKSLELQGLKGDIVTASQWKILHQENFDQSGLSSEYKVLLKHATAGFIVDSLTKFGRGKRRRLDSERIMNREKRCIFMRVESALHREQL